MIQSVRQGSVTQCFECGRRAGGKKNRKTEEASRVTFAAGEIVANGNILVLEQSFMHERKDGRGRDHAFWGNCLRCNRGKKKLFIVSQIKNNTVESCGCLNRDRLTVSQGYGWKYDGPKGEIIMRSSWELAVAHELDMKGIDWVYEPEGFSLDGTTYWPDFYLPDTKRYIEVKGYERDRSMKKAASFGHEYQIEIWRKTEVEGFVGIKTHQIAAHYKSCRMARCKTRAISSKAVSFTLGDRSYEFESQRAAADHFGIDYGRFKGRLKLRWDLVSALTTPVDTRRGRLSDQNVSVIKNFLGRGLGDGSGEFLARWFGVSKTCISDIKHGRSRVGIGPAK